MTMTNITSKQFYIFFEIYFLNAFISKKSEKGKKSESGFLKQNGGAHKRTHL